MNIYLKAAELVLDAKEYENHWFACKAIDELLSMNESEEQNRFEHLFDGNGILFKKIRQAQNEEGIKTQELRCLMLLFANEFFKKESL